MAWTSTLGNIATLGQVSIIVLRYFDGSYAPGGYFYSKGVPLAAASTVGLWDVGPQTSVLMLRLTLAINSQFGATRIYEQLRHRSANRYRLVAFSGYVFVAMLYS